MAKRITEHTKLKKGDIVRYPTNEGYLIQRKDILCEGHHQVIGRNARTPKIK